jgi:NAD(P)-dependent dehydrogenase (short-subunit alcohol dehydrogenase family)
LGDSPLPGTIYDAAEAVSAAGGKGVPARVDHADDAQVEALFAQVQREQGRLDILVNNACLIRDEVMHPLNFWEKPLNIIDIIDVGLRSSYVASYYAAPMMVAQKKGLVIFTSASGAVHYVFGPAYGVHKAGIDKLAADMAVDFKPFGVAALSIWMGPLLAERLKLLMEANPKKFGKLADTAETPEFTGHIIWALYEDPSLLELSGQTVIGAEMAVKYGIKDAGGRQPPSYRVTHGVEPRVQYPNIIR